MSQTLSRPAPLVGGVGQAGKAEGFRRTFSSRDSQPNDQHQVKSVAGCRIRLGQVQVRDNGGECVVAATREALLLALAMEGPRAFECPKTSAAFHEAGHCLVGAVQGSTPSKAAIWPIVELGRLQWVGRTYDLPKWRVDGKTDAQADLRQAQSQLAGVVSEGLFDPDYRQGSSLDEIITAQGIVHQAAAKLSRDPEQLWFETLIKVAKQLKANQLVVHQIADVLMRRGSIKARQLQQLLQLLESIDE